MNVKSKEVKSKKSILTLFITICLILSTTFVTVIATENNAPTQSGQCIWNDTTNVNKSINAINVDLRPTSFNITINDPDGDNINIIILSNESGNWTVVNQTSGSGLSNGAYSFTNTSWVDSYNTTYYISSNITDGTDWTNETYYFTTKALHYEIVTNVSQVSENIGIFMITAELPLPSGIDIVAEDEDIYLSSQSPDVDKEYVVTNPQAGDELYIHCVFAIWGSGSVDDFYVRIWLRTESGYTVTDFNVLVKDVSAGYRYLCYATDPWVAPGGYYKLSEDVDIGKNITETDEYNNYEELSFTVTPTDKNFDLKAEDAWLSSEFEDWDKEHVLDSTFDSGTEVFFHFHWIIFGVPETLTDPYYVKITLTGPGGFEFEKLMENEDYRKGSSYIKVCTYEDECNGWIAVAGDYTLTWKVDSQEDVNNEWNEGNNILSYDFTVEKGNQPPTVDITYPDDGQTVSGTITIAGTANDIDGTVTRVDVKTGNGDWKPVDDGTTSWSISWNTDTVPDGSCKISARSYDDDDCGSDIDSVTVNVDNEEDPDFYFLHVTDLHVTLKNKEQVMGALLEEINDMNPLPAFVVVTGDVADRGSTTVSPYTGITDPFINPNKPKLEGSKITTNSGGWFITPYDIPIYFCPGNHDAYGDLMWIGGSFDNYENTISDRYYHKSFTIGTHSIEIFSLTSGKDVEAWDWTPQGDGLKNMYDNEVTDFPDDVAASTADIKIVLTHHPYVDYHYGEEMVFINERDMFYDACYNNNVDLICSGHIHEGVVSDLAGNWLASSFQDYPFTPSTHGTISL